MLTLTSLHIYPIKSIGGIALEEARLEPRGFQYDRRWMLVDADGRFVSQREIAGLATLGTALEPPFLTVFLKKNPAQRIQIPLEPDLPAMPETEVQIWDDRCPARVHDATVNRWFSDRFGQALRLVYMPDSTHRPTNPKYVADTPVSFADGYPYLIIGQAALDALNRRMDNPLPMNRFRPNLVFSGGTPHEEDGWEEFRIGAQLFQGVKPCVRCIIPTTDQDTGLRGAEPLKTLAHYRQVDRKILFGLNVTWLGAETGWLRLGDRIEVLSKKNLKI
ncbi:MAG: MOSC domain-containing protein [Saprospiraceae bacterium]|nr:MOSC domain-containing protein [Saprospiraceae bacterium]